MSKYLHWLEMLTVPLCSVAWSFLQGKILIHFEVVFFVFLVTHITDEMPQPGTGHQKRLSPEKKGSVIMRLISENRGQMNRSSEE